MDTQNKTKDISLDNCTTSDILFLLRTNKISVDDLSDDNITRIFDSLRMGMVEQFCNIAPLVKRAVSINGQYLRNASENLKEDKEIVLKAVQNNGWSITYAAHSLRDDTDIALAAVSNNGLVLQVLTPEQRDNKEIVLAAVSNIGYALEYAGPNCIKDRDITLTAINKFCPLESIDSAYYSDEEIMLAAFKVKRKICTTIFSSKFSQRSNFYGKGTTIHKSS